MSLTYEGFVEAHRRYEALSEKVRGVLGYDPLTSDHWGGVHMYNVRITERITEEGILEIRAKYERWKKDVLALLAEYGITPSEEEWLKMFDVDPMGGTLRFLRKSVNVEMDAIYYTDVIEKHQRTIEELKKVWRRYDL